MRVKYEIIPRSTLSIDLPETMARKRTPGQVAALKASIANLRLRGESYEAIAQKLGITPSYARTLYGRAIKEWRARALADVAEHRGLELAKLDEVEREAWKALERVKQGLTAETQTVVNLHGQNGTIEKRTVKVSSPSDILNILLKCMDIRAKLLGLYTPEKLDIKVRHEQADANIIELRLAEYRDALAAGRVRAPSALVSGDGAGQPLDPAQAAPEAGPVPDLDGRDGPDSA
jgi:phage tail sheath protein FI